MEVLVVMGILIVIMLLVSVGYKRVYVSSDRVRCQANLRKIYAASMLWSSDNGGILPDSRLWQTASSYQLHGRFWSIVGYLEVSDSEQNTETVLTCPASNRVNPSVSLFKRTYSLNRYTGYRDGIRYSGPGQLNAVTEPEMLFFTDGVVRVLPGDKGEYYSFLNPGHLRGATHMQFLHDEKTHAVYVSGNVDSYDQQKFFDRFDVNEWTSPLWMGVSSF